ncbi:sensor histidine kinase [Nitrogeniibacter mangrovi]|uniref:C4-dicarboxylate transport sensor protein DctB n=1 Tax=Nitrogeniibacter mangrovi TaxID=2016596 RepID=A0A6C1B522_9RHOO|nr:ATP-binding protein [Nitrogeniibacter mangrovi]QID17965.1 sensor histidine kinase [Nitrogeniibacter mangrovi]
MTMQASPSEPSTPDLASRPLSSDDVATAHARQLRAGWYRQHARTIVTTAAIALAVIVIWQVWRISEANALATVRRIGDERLTLYASTVDGALDRYRYLPFVLAMNPAVQTLVRDGGGNDRVNVYLETVNARAGAAALFVMDIHGQTLASSNWSEPLSFVGQNYAFRPYFRSATAGEAGEFFAIGVTTGRPGYFMSAPIHGPTGILGVAVVKVDLDRLQADWSEGGETVLVSDENGVVFLSSRPNWKYHSLGPLSADTLAQIRARRQYNHTRLQPLDYAAPHRGVPDAIRIDGDEFIERSHPLSQPGWRLHYLSPMAPVREQVLGAVGIATVSTFLLVVFALYLRERRARQRSRDQAREAMALRALSTRLQAEVDERRRTEHELRSTQDELIQAGKLAALGQMSAAIAHELNQPIAAIRTFTASGERLLELDRREDLAQNLRSVSQLTERMALITGQLKTFARKSEGRNRPVALREPLDAALALLDGQIRAAGVTLTVEEPAPGLTVNGDPVRIEQVLVNLLRNGLDAMKDAPERHLSVRIARDAEDAVLRIRDNGHGIAAGAMTQLFDPFFTTKEVGEGVGLGLSISYGIVADLGGTVRAHNNTPDTGATFVVRLPLIDTPPEPTP